MAEDLFDSLLKLEDKFYDEGHSLGVEDGRRAGLIEGRIFGLEKGFEKYAAMGMLHGRSVVWAGRLPASSQDHQGGRPLCHKNCNEEKPDQILGLCSSDGAQDGQDKAAGSHVWDQKTPDDLPSIPDNSRLEKHIRTLYALVEPSSLSVANSEASVSEFDDRFKRAEGKTRIIKKLIGEENQDGTINGSSLNNKAGDSGIKDINILQARH